MREENQERDKKREERKKASKKEKRKREWVCRENRRVTWKLSGSVLFFFPWPYVAVLYIVTCLTLGLKYSG